MSQIPSVRSNADVLTQLYNSIASNDKREWLEGTLVAESKGQVGSSKVFSLPIQEPSHWDKNSLGIQEINQKYPDIDIKWEKQRKEVLFTLPDGWKVAKTTRYSDLFFYDICDPQEKSKIGITCKTAPWNSYTMVRFL